MQALLAEDAAEKEKGQSQKSKVKKAKAKGECQPAKIGLYFYAPLSHKDRAVFILSSCLSLGTKALSVCVCLCLCANQKFALQLGSIGQHFAACVW